MLLLPFRVKTVIRRFPYVTVTLMAINLIAYYFTTKNFLSIRPEMYKQYAFGLGVQGHTAWWQFFTASFLHSDLVHLGANMLFLWVFGPAVEERIRAPRFLLIYFLSGAAGAFFFAGLNMAFIGSFHPWVGATGSIIGIMGAYWYIFSWSQISVFYWFVVWYGVVDIAAFWVVGFYLVLDLAEGLVYHALGFRGAIVNLAHTGAAAVAIILCIASRVRRDTEAVSEAKALRADDLDLSNLPLSALQTMLEEDPTDAELIRAMIAPVLRWHDKTPLEQAMKKAGPTLINKDPRLVAQYLLEVKGDPKVYQPVHLLHLAGQLERINDNHRALAIYRLIVDRFPTNADAESALYRMALSSWNTFKDANAARTYLDEMQWRFPNGEMKEFGQQLNQKLPPA